MGKHQIFVQFMIYAMQKYVCMYKHMGQGFFDETLRSKKWHMQLLFYDKAWTKLARSKIRKGQ